MKQPQCIPCNGTNPKTGQAVGTLHRWSQNGICDFCGRSYGSVHAGKVFTPATANRGSRQSGKTEAYRTYDGL